MIDDSALCDMDPNTLECFECAIHDTSGHSNSTHPGLCTHVPLDLENENVDRRASVHDKCTTYKWNYLPSLSKIGRYCTCFRPMDAERDSLFVDALYIEEEEEEEREEEEEKEEEDGCDGSERRVTRLWSKDFLFGTLRIRECGTYKLMEDINLNMNAPLDPISFDVAESGMINNADDLHWVPDEAQKADIDGYPSYNFIGAFSMGFFAGISIEADDVIIDLNGFELKMHRDFYLQQRFFSLIELASKPFISGQGMNV